MAEEAAKIAAPLPSRQFIWPASTGVKNNGIGFSSTCYGCFERRKRSAEADPGLVLPHPFGFYGYVKLLVQNFTTRWLSPKIQLIIFFLSSLNNASL